MPHCDEDDIALMALGEPARPSDAEHLSTCAQCQQRLDDLTALVRMSRDVISADLPQVPPTLVWEGILEGVAEPASVTPLRTAAPASPRRGPRWLLLAAAAVLGVIVGGVGTALVVTRDAPAELIAQGELAPVGESPVTGTAAVQMSAAGETLTVSIPGLSSPGDGYYEVWMATPDTSTMVAIGTLNPGETATYTLPAGMSVAAYPVVDVSLEHFDGDNTHSATSIVRGTLQS